MSEPFSLEEAKKLVKLARKSIEYTMACRGKYSEEMPKRFSQKQGVFVTIKKFPSKDLRGCIGFPEPVMPLWNAVMDAARSAAFSDPRFEQLKTAELDKITVEISVLSVPEEMKCEKEKLQENIVIGEDGLIVRNGFNSGLLLPQVAVEWQWNAKTFLEQTCAKAGLERDAWKSSETKIFKFQAQIFQEMEPRGEIREVKIRKC